MAPIDALPGRKSCVIPPSWRPLSVQLYSAWLRRSFRTKISGIFLDVLSLLCIALTAVGAWDMIQPNHSLKRNYPILAHFRFFLEKIRPEIRQYFLESETDGTPFNRAKRSIVYQRAKSQLDKRPFGTQLDVYASRLRMDQPFDRAASRRKAMTSASSSAGPTARSPIRRSLLNISAMSFGALSANAIRALNKGAQARRLRARHRRRRLQPLPPRERRRPRLGDRLAATSAAATPTARSAPERFAAAARDPQIKMIEIKLSQGAKPGHGGVLPGAKVIARDRDGPRRADGRSTASRRRATRRSRRRSR